MDIVSPARRTETMGRIRGNPRSIAPGSLPRRWPLGSVEHPIYQVLKFSLGSRASLMKSFSVTSGSIVRFP
jgi:hypothetical protein